MINEQIEHTIKVDDNISMTVMIPKVITALEFKALSMKANKIFNIADVCIQDKPSRTTQRFVWDDDKKLVSEYKKDKRAYAKRLGITLAKLQHRYNYVVNVKGAK